MLENISSAVLHWRCQTISSCVSRKNKCSSVCVLRSAALQHQRRCKVNLWSKQDLSSWNVMSYIFDVKLVQHISPISFRMSSYWILQPVIYIPCQNSVPIQKVQWPLLVRRMVDNRCVWRNDFYAREQSSSPISDRRLMVGFTSVPTIFPILCFTTLQKKKEKKNQYCPVV